MSTLSCLHDAKKRTSSERDGRGRSSSGGRRARTSSTTLMPLFFVFQRFGYEGNVFGGFCSDNRVEGDCFLPPRRRKKALQRDRGILNGDDEDGIQRCRRFFSRASQRKKRNVRLFLFAVGCSLRERFLTSSRRVRRRCDNSGTHGEQQGAKNEWSKARRDRIQKLSRGEEESDKAISLFFYYKKKKKKKKKLRPFRRNHDGSSRIQSCVSSESVFPSHQTDQSIADSFFETARRTIEANVIKNSFAKKRFFSSFSLFRIRSSCDGSASRPRAARQGH